MTKRLPWITGVVLCAAVVAWTFSLTPRYASDALLQVQRQSGGASLPDAVSSLPGAGLLGLGDDDVETEIGVLTSRRVLDAVIDTLALQLRVAGADAARSTLVQAQVTAATAEGAAGAEPDGELVLRPAADGGWTVSVTELRPALDVPATLPAGDTLTLGALRITPLARGDARVPLTLVLRPRYVVREAIAKRLEVRRQTAGAKLIALAYEDEDHELAAQVLERVLAEYLTYSAGTARGDAGTTAAELRRQVAQQGERMAAAEEALRRYQETTGLVVPEEQAAAQVKRYAELRSALDALDVQRTALQALVAAVGAKAAREPGTAAYRQLATFPSLIANRAIQELLLALLELENERSRLRAVRTDDNADVRRLDARIQELERELDRIARQSLESMEQQITPMRAAIADIDRELLALPEQEMRYLRLYRERTLLNEGYLALQKQLRLTEVQDALRLDRVRVVDAPEVPDPAAPAFPRVPVHLVLALLLGICGGGAVAAAQSARAAATSVRESASPEA